MKKTIIYSLALFVFGICFLLSSIPAFPNDCQLTPKKVLKEAKRACKKKDLEYDQVLGPYFVRSQSDESKSGYMVYFAELGKVKAEYWFCGENCGGLWVYPMKMKTVRVNDLLLDSTEVKEVFETEKGLKAIFVQLVFPAKFWSVTQEFLAWWVIDEEGECYYILTSRSPKNISSFKELAEVRKKYKRQKEE